MIRIVHDLRKARGSILKIQVLEREKLNEPWLNYLKAMYDTSLNYYVSTPSDMTFREHCDIPGMLMAAKNLSDRTYTGNQARRYALQCSKVYGELFRLILKGSLGAGVSTTTINKVYPGLIPEFKVMLARDVEVPTYPVLASTKFDGVRVIAIVRDAADTKDFTAVQLFTRAGKSLYIESLVNSMADLPVGVYDGELVHGNGLVEGRTKITGDVNRCLKGTAVDIKNYTYCVFDYLGIAEWYAQKSLTTYSDRYLELMEALVNVKYVTLVDQKLIHNLDAVNSMFEDKVNKGYEGLILRYPDSAYEWKRTNNLIKKKSLRDIILECVDVTEGTGKYEGMIGALVCEGITKDSTGLIHIKVKVGTGLSDFDRERDPSDYIGSRIEVFYNEIVIAESADDHSLFLPRFKRILNNDDT